MYEDGTNAFERYNKKSKSKRENDKHEIKSLLKKYLGNDTMFTAVKHA
jgi:hypothetical protein